MKLLFEELKQELKAKNISLSHQRLKVLEYFAENQCHPTADQIFKHLQKDIPTLSRTTVYNTLKTLTAAGLVRVVAIEENENRYDLVTTEHGHFKCEACGTVYDFDIDMDALACGGLNNFKINDKSVYFKGICQSCLANIDKK